MAAKDPAPNWESQLIELDSHSRDLLTTLPLATLANSPDCGDWLAAIWIRARCKRWPGWDLECALSTVDKQLRINSVQFLMQPPKFWGEDLDAEFPAGVTARRIENEGLPASTAVSLMNKIFGASLVYLNGRMDTQNRELFERAAGIKLTWKTSSQWDWLGQTLKVELDEFSFATFYCDFPSKGPLLQRAELTARSFVNAAHARHRIIGASLNPDERAMD